MPHSSLFPIRLLLHSHALPAPCHIVAFSSIITLTCTTCTGRILGKRVGLGFDSSLFRSFCRTYYYNACVATLRHTHSLCHLTVYRCVFGYIVISLLSSIDSLLMLLRSFIDSHMLLSLLLCIVPSEYLLFCSCIVSPFNNFLNNHCSFSCGPEEMVFCPVSCLGCIRVPSPPFPTTLCAVASRLCWRC